MQELLQPFQSIAHLFFEIKIKSFFTKSGKEFFLSGFGVEFH